MEGLQPVEDFVREVQRGLLLKAASCWWDAAHEEVAMHMLRAPVLRWPMGPGMLRGALLRPCWIFHNL
jgi:hypothetical protein